MQNAFHLFFTVFAAPQKSHADRTLTYLILYPDIEKARCVLHLAFTVFNKYHLLFFVFFIAFVRLLGSVFCCNVKGFVVVFDCAVFALGVDCDSLIVFVGEQR